MMSLLGPRSDDHVPMAMARIVCLSTIQVARLRDSSGRLTATSNTITTDFGEYGVSTRKVSKADLSATSVQ